MRAEVLIGDCRKVLTELPAESVHCVVTSPPYFGLRDYGTGKWEGGEDGCDHVEMVCGMSDRNTLGPNGYLPPTNAANVGKQRQYREVCRKCGSRRVDQQIGLEATPAAFVAELVGVFREVRRVLRPDGVLWLNLGDSFAGGGCGSRDQEKWPKQSRNDHMPVHAKRRTGLKPKDLIGIPWRVAFALQDDGWWLRCDCIWDKPNGMPESVADRPTRNHEYLFLLTKSQDYYYDAASIREPMVKGAAGSTFTRGKTGVTGLGRVSQKERIDNPDGRNKRSVWTVPTSPYKGAHYATFPPALVAPMILAGCPEGGTVLDPFGGSGTVGEVATKLGRRSILIELNPEYAWQAETRNLQYGLDMVG